MKFFEIIDQIEQTDPEFVERISPRRDAIKNMTGFGTKLAVAAMPFALTALLKKAYGQTGPSAAILNTLNIALRLEYFEADFYTAALAQTSLIPAADKTAYFNAISAHETAHVNFLKTVLGASALPKQTQAFDYTAAGNYPTVMSNYDVFLAVAQVIEDTGVRAYKGQAGVLLKEQVYLTAALNIHSVEARHAAALRYLRRTRGGAAAALKPWITGSSSVFNDTGAGAATDPSYVGENNIVQGGVTITDLAGATANSKISYSAAVECFDEPLTTAQVVTAVTPFRVTFS